MTPSELRALASRVETEEPTDELRAAVLTAFGSEADPGSKPDPLRSVDDARAFQPGGWMVSNIQQDWPGFFVGLYRPARPIGIIRGISRTEPRARTAASLRALAWEMEHAGG